MLKTLKRKHHRSRLRSRNGLVFGLLILSLLVWLALMNYPGGIRAPDEPDRGQSEEVIKSEPKLGVEVLAGGLSHPWDVGFLTDGILIYSERSGKISVLQNGSSKLLGSPPDVVAKGEGGMMGLAVDPEFEQNRYIYACFNSRLDEKPDVRVVRWKVSANTANLTDRRDIVTGIPSNTSGQTGRHSGCRPRFGPDGALWIGTGDAAIYSNPQDPKSLGGKILRVDRNGEPARGNMTGQFDPRVYSYGHRNVQGLAFNSEGSEVIGYSIEHGSDTDDEVNPLVPGNFGWDPAGPGYRETVPLTDKVKFPEAIEAIWSSGSPTIAPSGGTFLLGKKWGSWEGALAVAALKGRHLRVFGFGGGNQIVEENKVLTSYGRLRTASLGPDGNLYLTTDNGGNDQILKVVPR